MSFKKPETQQRLGTFVLEFLGLLGDCLRIIGFISLFIGRKLCHQESDWSNLKCHASFFLMELEIIKTILKWTNDKPFSIHETANLSIIYRQLLSRLSSPSGCLYPRIMKKGVIDLIWLLVNIMFNGIKRGEGGPKPKFLTISFVITREYICQSQNPGNWTCVADFQNKYPDIPEEIFSNLGFPE